MEEGGSTEAEIKEMKMGGTVPAVVAAVAGRTSRFGASRKDQARRLPWAMSK